MNFIRKVPIHPLASASYPILALVAANLNQSQSVKFHRALGASFLALLILLVTSWVLTKNLGKAAAITTLIFILFYTYGHVHSLTAKKADPTLWLSAVWIAILIVGIRWILTHPHRLQALTQSLNWISFLLLVFPLYTLILPPLQNPKVSSPDKFNLDYSPLEIDFTVEAANPLPDIYYIVLDGYARADTLAQKYDYDNQPLLDYLEGRGFYIAEESYANYNQTILSFPTSLNMTFLQNLVDTEAANAFDYWDLAHLIHDNQVFDLATDAGYQVVVFGSGHSATEIRNVDHYLGPEVENTSPTSNTISIQDRNQLDSFEFLLLETTALRPILPTIFQDAPEDPKYENRRQHIRFTFSNLAKYAQEEGVYFIFAHLISPHPPFVFNAAGEPKVHWRPYSIADGSHWIGSIGTQGEYIAGYRDQISYINMLLMATIEEILTQSETPPVIIIQGDHGPGAYFDWNSMERTDLTERMNILNAYYFPGGDQGWLYPSITPVNTFRVVFNRYLGQDFELHSDLAYFSEWINPYHFTEITEQLQMEIPP